MIEKLRDKYVFFDVDGTLAEYKYRDKLYGGEFLGTWMSIIRRFVVFGFIL